MKSENNQLLTQVETHLRQGKYVEAQQIAQQIAINLSGIELTTTKKMKVVTKRHPILMFPVERGYQNYTVRNDGLLVIKFKAKLFESLSLLYQKENKMGLHKIDELHLEIDKIKTSLFEDQKINLNQFIDNINNEIQETYLLNNYLDVESQFLKNKNVDFDSYSLMTEEELYMEVGKQILPELRDKSALLNHKLLQIKASDTIFISPSQSIKNNEQLDNFEFGQKLTNSLSKRMYKILCDPDSRKGEELVNIENIQNLVTGSLTLIGVTSSMVVFPFIAIVIRFGIAAYCDHAKPKKINN